MSAAKPMPIIVDFRDIVTEIVRRKNIHTGIWALYVEFGITAANFAFAEEGQPAKEIQDIAEMPKHVLPTALIPIQKIGIIPALAETNISVDAAKVNPKPRQGRTKKARDK